MAKEKAEIEEIEEKLTKDTEKLDKEFKEHSVAEFFKKNKQMLGFYGKVRTLTMIIHEYITNALDACEETEILPNIDVKIDELGKEYYEVTITDNGPGINKENVGRAFGKLLAGTKFHRLVQSRGQQGIGCSGCTMLSQMTTGKASKIITGRKGQKPISLEITIDPKTNEPKITNLKEINKDFTGTAIRAKFKDVIYRDSEQGPLEYLRRTAIANPHAQITFRDPFGEKIKFKRTSNTIPDLPQEIRPHPKGVTVDEIITLVRKTSSKTVSSFINNDFDRTGIKSITEVKKRVSFDLNKDPKKIDWNEAEEIIKAFREIDFIAPTTDALRPIGEDQIKKSLENIVKPEFLTVLTRKASVYAGGFPFQVEIAIAYGGDAGRTIADGKKMEIMRFANRVPLPFDAGNCALTHAVQSIDWKRYNIRDAENSPVTVFINLISVHIPYTGAGKQSVADEEDVLEEVRLALMNTGRRAGIYISHKKKEAENQMKRKMFYKYIPEITRSLNWITKKDQDKLKEKMEKLVLEKLKLDEKKEQEEITKMEDKMAKDLKSSIKKEKPTKKSEK